MKVLEKFSLLSIRHLGIGSNFQSVFILLCLEGLSDPRWWRNGGGACLGSCPLVTVSGTFSDVFSHFSSGNTYSKNSHLNLHTCAMWLGGKQGDVPGHKILYLPRDRKWGMGSISWVGTDLGNCCFPIRINLYTCCGARGVIPAFGRPRWEEYKFETRVLWSNLGCTMKPSPSFIPPLISSGTSLFKMRVLSLLLSGPIITTYFDSLSFYICLAFWSWSAEFLASSLAVVSTVTRNFPFAED